MRNTTYDESGSCDSCETDGIHNLLDIGVTSTRINYEKDSLLRAIAQAFTEAASQMIRCRPGVPKVDCAVAGHEDTQGIFSQSAGHWRGLCTLGQIYIIEIRVEMCWLADHENDDQQKKDADEWEKINLAEKLIAAPHCTPIA